MTGVLFVLDFIFQSWKPALSFVISNSQFKVRVLQTCRRFGLNRKPAELFKVQHWNGKKRGDHFSSAEKMTLLMVLM